ncbi:hypothetical protein KFK09_025392 [Dendrobium nobile]|uniref:Uncharacterized protein n=1 Tax=Dendrobium nobile TaxID=94219 RepID=A0A8T3AHL5_DENNO|nr:hypothetical protein KFK09_025392 [Dendrobium nobile]
MLFFLSYLLKDIVKYIYIYSLFIVHSLVHYACMTLVLDVLFSIFLVKSLLDIFQGIIYCYKHFSAILLAKLFDSFVLELFLCLLCIVVNSCGLIIIKTTLI